MIHIIHQRNSPQYDYRTTFGEGLTKISRKLDLVRDEEQNRLQRIQRVLQEKKGRANEKELTTRMTERHRRVLLKG